MNKEAWNLWWLYKRLVWNSSERRIQIAILSKNGNGANTSNSNSTAWTTFLRDHFILYFIKELLEFKLKHFIKQWLHFFLNSYSILFFSNFSYRWDQKSAAPWNNSPLSFLPVSLSSLPHCLSLRFSDQWLPLPDTAALLMKYNGLLKDIHLYGSIWLTELLYKYIRPCRAIFKGLQGQRHRKQTPAINS